MKIRVFYVVGIALWFFVFAARYGSMSKKYPVGENIVVKEYIKTEPRIFENSQLVSLSGMSVFLPKYPKLFMGDYLEVAGVVGVDQTLEDPKILNTTQTHSILFTFRKNAIEWLAKKFRPDSAALIAGITLGSKALLRDTFWDDLIQTGTAHVVVASGMNVVMVGGFVFSLFLLFVKRKRALVLTLGSVFFYVVLAGFEAPLVRAFIMYALTLFGQFIGRVTYSFRILIITAIVMITFRPDWIGDWGFILSFSATLSLMLFESKVQKKVQFIPTFFRDSFSSTLAAQILVAPLLLVAFGRISLVSPLVNTLVLFVVAPITILGMIAVCIHAIVPVLASLFVIPLYVLSWWFVMIIHIFS